MVFDAYNLSNIQNFEVSDAVLFFGKLNKNWPGASCL